MEFYTYMVKTYGKQNSQEGDLARDMQQDRKNFPRTKGNFSWKQGQRIAAYLEENGADPEVLRVFESCWKEYRENRIAKRDEWAARWLENHKDN